MSSAVDHDVIVVGAGLAGLRAATVLAEAGLDVVVLEASDDVGGRQRTDVVDGFRLDRGFQVLNPAYRSVRRWADVPGLQLQPFPVGVHVRRADDIPGDPIGLATLADPRRDPLLIPASLRSGLVDPGALFALARWAAPAVLAPRRLLRRAAGGADRAVRDGWDAAGFHGALRAEVVEPFLAGVLADDRFDTSDTFVRWLVSLFLRGTPGLPADGIQALPTQLAARARSAGAEIRLEHRVAGVRRDRGRVDVDIVGADAASAAAVIVAVDAPHLTSLTGVGAAPMRGLQTWWFAPEVAPSASGMLAVDGRRRGPIVNTAIISRTAPTYAPAGRHLVQATCLLADAGAPEAEVRTQLGEIWRADARSWPLLRRDDIRSALPARPAPLRPSPVRAADHLYLAGDHRTSPSIEGALVSGDRAARILLADRDARRR
ncbi:FAD-dependent oxidoreductase [Microbacterium sp. NPDC055312]